MLYIHTVLYTSKTATVSLGNKSMAVGTMMMSCLSVIILAHFNAPQEAGAVCKTRTQTHAHTYQHLPEKMKGVAFPPDKLDGMDENWLQLFYKHIAE